MFGFMSRLLGKETQQQTTHTPRMPLDDEDEGLWEGERIGMRLNDNLPVSILNEEGDILCTGRVTKNSSISMIVGRLPGAIKLPVLEQGTDVVVSAYNIDSEAVRFGGKVRESTSVNLVVDQLRQLDRVTHRGSHRLPVHREGKLFVPNDGKESTEVPCTVLDISMTGARVESDYKFVTGDTLRLRFELMDGDGVNSANAEVVWVKSRDGVTFQYGLLFEELEGWKKKYLRQSIEELRETLERGAKVARS